MKENKNNKKSVLKWLTATIITLLVLLGILEYEQETEENKKEEIFSNTIPNSLGVNIHYVGERIDTDLIKDVGFKIVRQDIYWGRVEKEKGVFDFKSEGYDTLTESLVKNKIRPYYILGYSNKLYEKERSIVTKEGQDAYIRYVKEVVSRYKNKGIIWEIWNEPNVTWETKPNFEDYSNLLKRASKTVKETDPSGVVVAPALAGINKESLDWLEGILKKDVLNYIDAVSVHPYRAQNPETAIADYGNLRTLLSKYSDKNITVISGEWGYSTSQGSGTIINEDTQADYLVRMFMINSLLDIPISIWYDWKNDGTDPLNREHNFGLVQNDIKVTKKSYYAINALNYNLSGYHLKERIDLGNSDDYVLHFTNKDNESTLVCWTSKGKHQVNIPFNFTEGRILSIFGEKIGDINKSSQLNLEMTNTPKYIVLTKD